MISTDGVNVHNTLWEANGRSTAYGSIATVPCVDGYEAPAGAVGIEFECGISGAWETDGQRCSARTCPEQIEENRARSANRERFVNTAIGVGTQIVTQCMDGFTGSISDSNWVDR